jgi:hypothetical protein
MLSAVELVVTKSQSQPVQNSVLQQLLQPDRWKTICKQQVIDTAIVQ